MEGLDYWRLCDELSLVQAALLIVGVDPANSQEWVREWEPHKRPEGFDAAMAALTHAVLAARLKATIRKNAREYGWMEQPEADEIADMSDQGFRMVDDLRTWLRGRGIKSGFFFPQETESEDYLNESDEHYSPKLAAAVTAWEAVSRDPSLLRGKTVKQAILIWLRRNADQYGLTKDDGSPNEQGIEEVAKIANWDTKGGAPKTPSE
jgi:hypothetical protein